MLDFLRSLRGRPTGEALDIVGRKVRLKRWRRRDHITVQSGGRRAELRSRPGSTDAEVIFQCFVGKQYEVPRLYGVPPLHYDAVEAAYLGMIEAGKTPLIIDCGANIGASSVWFDLRYPGSRIIAVEPAAANVELLRANTVGRPNVSVLTAGIGPDDDKAFVRDQGGGHWGYVTTTAPTGAGVDIVSLAKLIERQTGCTPFILKIDIEGAEQSLFQHSLDRIGSFPVIIMEPHDFYLPGQWTASPFFRFHADAGRDFAFHYENVFSMDYPALTRPAGLAPDVDGRASTMEAHPRQSRPDAPPHGPVGAPLA